MPGEISPSPSINFLLKAAEAVFLARGQEVRLGQLEMESGYRAALVDGCPAADEDQ